MTRAERREPIPSGHLRPSSLRRLMLKLRKHVPLRAPVRLVQRPGVRSSGEYVLAYAWYKQRWTPHGLKRPVRYRIVIDSRLPIGEKWECVVHEYAHCLDRDRRPKRPKDCHDARWGQCFARVFRASVAKL
jgi:hypothetical protein